MAEPAPIFSDEWEIIEEPDVSHLVTEDDKPVDNPFQAKQCELLTEALRVSWPQGRPFVCLADVGLYPMAESKALLVPDVLLSLGVQLPADIHEKKNRAYFVWRYGKPPEVVIEIVSNKAGGEDTHKLESYAKIKIPYYAIYDPQNYLSSRALRIYKLDGASYIEKLDRFLPEVNLGFTIWEGQFDGSKAHWLRWVDAEGELLANGEEAAERAEWEAARAEQEAERAAQADARAEQEAERAEQADTLAKQEAERAERLAQKLRELGVEPDEF